MDFENLPSPKESLSYNITGFEYLANLKVIDILWILCPQQRKASFDNLVLKATFIKSQSEKNPTKKKDLEKDFNNWAKNYIVNDNVIWFYIEKSYELTLRDFLRGFPSVMDVLKRQESFIKNVTPQQQRFLDILTQSDFCKALAKDQKVTWWQWVKVNLQIMSEKEYKGLSDMALDAQIKIVKLSMAMIFNQSIMIAEMQNSFNKLFGDYMFEVNNHYYFNYFYYKGDFKDLLDSPEIENEELNDITEQNKNSNNLTNSQRVLIYYFFLKQYGLEPRKNIDVAPLARFIHLVTGTTFTKIQNSVIYDKLLKAPNFKNDKELIKDLSVIRPLFEKYGFDEILQSIDIEYDTAKKEGKQ